MPAFVTKHLPPSLPRRLAAGFGRVRQPSRLLAMGIALLIFSICANEARAASRLKDMVNFEGVRDNNLVGYGLVVGLNGTGDTLTNSPFTERSLIGMLERLGINENGDFSTIKTKDIAAVIGNGHPAALFCPRQPHRRRPCRRWAIRKACRAAYCW